MEFTLNDKMYLASCGFVPEEPAEPVASNEPSGHDLFKKLCEQNDLNHFLGKTPATSEDFGTYALFAKLTAPRDHRELQTSAPPDMFQPFTKRAENEGDEELRTEYSHGTVIAKLRGGRVISTRYVAKGSE